MFRSKFKKSLHFRWILEAFFALWSDNTPPEGLSASYHILEKEVLCVYRCSSCFFLYFSDSGLLNFPPKFVRRTRAMRVFVGGFFRVRLGSWDHFSDGSGSSMVFFFSFLFFFLCVCVVSDHHLFSLRPDHLNFPRQ